MSGTGGGGRFPHRVQPGKTREQRERENLTTNRKRTLKKVEKLLSKLYHELGLAGFAGLVTTDSAGNVNEITFLSPRGSPIENCLNNSDIRIPIEKALQLSQDQAARVTGPARSLLRPDHVIPRPPVPISKMTFGQMFVWFPIFLRHLALMEGLRGREFRVYAKKDSVTEKVTTPTHLKIYDEIAENILPRSTMFSMHPQDNGLDGQTYFTKLKTCSAYILGI